MTIQASDLVQDEFLTIDEVAGILKVERRTIERLITGRKLQSTKVGRAVRIKRAWLDRMVERN